MPGGGWDHVETDMQALARELYEEVGYTDKFAAEPIATATFWIEPKQAWLLWIVYDVTPENHNFSVGYDSSQIAFINPQTLDKTTNQAERWIFEHLC